MQKKEEEHLHYTKREKSDLLLSILPSLVHKCSAYRHRKDLEGETKPRVKNRRIGPPKSGGSLEKTQQYLGQLL